MANSGFGGPPPLPRESNDLQSPSLSAVNRRERFAREHPEVLLATRREGNRIMFDVSEPHKAAVAYDDPDTMMDDLEARYPVSPPPSNQDREPTPPKQPSAKRRRSPITR